MIIMRKTHQKAAYHLHIDAIPAAHQSAPHAAVLTHSAKRFPKLRAFLWDKVQFVFVSAVVFAVIYTAINFQALSLNAVHYYNEWRGFVSPLEDIVKDKPEVPERLAAAKSAEELFNAAEKSGAASVIIPPLNLEVYPTDMRLIIPRINQNVPIIGVTNENLVARKWEELEKDIQKSLRSGVIHYPGTALPGDNGNVVLTGHSSYYAWDPGRFKDVFALLHDVEMGDKMVVFFNQKKFVYEVSNIKTVLPQHVDVLGPAPAEQLTLITCTPIGTNLKRLVVTARLIEKN